MYSLYHGEPNDLFYHFGKAVSRAMSNHQLLHQKSGVKSSIFKTETTMRDRYLFTANTLIEELRGINSGNYTQARTQLDSYMGAHLLHAPKTRALSNSPSDQTELQPTAKGLAYLDEWYKVYQSELSERSRAVVEEALASPYNTMELIRLERSLLTRKLQLSTGLAMVLWNRIAAEMPQHYEDFKEKALLSCSRTSLHSQDATSTSSSELTESPYFLRSMIHPNSRNHMQYWNSTGMRLFRNLRFEKQAKSKFRATRSYNIDYVVSGSALLQWIMDCTTVESISEGKKVAELVLSNGFLKQIIDPPIDAIAGVTAEHHHRSSEKWKSWLFRLTPRGSRYCTWDYLIDDVSMDIEDLESENIIAEAHLNNDNVEKLGSDERWSWELGTLPDLENSFGKLLNFNLIQKEPALKVLFREEVEARQSSESLHFVEASQHILLLIAAAIDCRETVTRSQRLDLEARTLLDRVCKLYVREGSPFELNLSEKARNRLLEAAEQNDLELVTRPLARAKQHCIDLLQDAIASFRSGERTSKIPQLRACIVAEQQKKAMNQRLPMKPVYLWPVLKVQ